MVQSIKLHLPATKRAKWTYSHLPCRTSLRTYEAEEGKVDEHGISTASRPENGHLTRSQLKHRGHVFNEQKKGCGEDAHSVKKETASYSHQHFPNEWLDTLTYHHQFVFALLGNSTSRVSPCSDTSTSGSWFYWFVPRITSKHWLHLGHARSGKVWKHFGIVGNSKCRRQYPRRPNGIVHELYT